MTEYGETVSPKADLYRELDDKPDSLDIVEIPIGEMERPVDEMDSEKLRKELENNGYGLIVHLPFGQPVVTKLEEFNSAEINYMKKVLEFAEKAGAKKAVLHPNIRYRENSEDVEDRFTEQLEKLNEIAKKRGVELCVENMPPQINSAANDFELAETLEELNISMCFDTGHGYSSMGQEDMEELISEHSDNISHIHFQDTREGEDLHMPIGSGEIDFQALSKKFDGFDGTAVAEVFTDCREYRDISLRRMRETV